MSLSKLFQNWLWKNKQVERTTPLNSTNLQKINDAIDEIDDRVIDIDDSVIHVDGGTFDANTYLYGAGNLNISTNSNLALSGNNVNLMGNVDIDGTLYVGGEDVYYDGTNFKVNVSAYMYEAMRTGDTYLGITKSFANVYIGSSYRPYFYVKSITSNINSQHGTVISAGDPDDTLANDIDVVNYGGNISLICEENSDGNVGIATYNGSEIATRNNLIYFKNMIGTNAVGGYIKVCNITINKVYRNSVLTILFTRRNENKPTELNLRFDGTGVLANTTISSFTINGPCKECYINGSGASWDIYIKKADSYDNIDILDFWIPKYLYDGITITWYGTQINSAISGWTQATDATCALKSDLAISYETLDDVGISIASGAGYTFKATPTKAGYTIAGILGFRVGGSYGTYCITSQIWIENGTINWTVHNTSANTATAKFYATILWIAN